MSTDAQADRADLQAAGERLSDFIGSASRLFVLTGAGCSTASGIPDYRDRDGAWKRRAPVNWQDYAAQPAVRQRYWARNLVGWRMIRERKPNAAHHALAAFEERGRLSLLLTQNVDGLHQAAGSRNVVDLHGRMDRMRCVQCGAMGPRDDYQDRLEHANPGWREHIAASAPDGDADLDGLDFSGFVVPACQRCEGLLKPDVVFFGENVPAERVSAAFDALASSDAMLVVGSSLMVWSGLRFVDRAHQLGLPIASVNLGRTRADDRLTLKLNCDCTALLASVARSSLAERQDPVE